MWCSGRVIKLSVLHTIRMIFQDWRMFMEEHLGMIYQDGGCSIDRWRCCDTCSEGKEHDDEKGKSW